MKKDLEKIVEPSFMQVSASLVKSGTVNAVKGTYNLARAYVIGSLPYEVKETILGFDMYNPNIREVTENSAAIQTLLVTPATTFATTYYLSAGQVGTSVGITIAATVMELIHSMARTEAGHASGHIAVCLPYYALKAAAYLAYAPICLTAKACKSVKEDYKVRKDKIEYENKVKAEKRQLAQEGALSTCEVDDLKGALSKAQKQGALSLKDKN